MCYSVYSFVGGTHTWVGGHCGYGLHMCVAGARIYMCVHTPLWMVAALGG